MTNDNPLAVVARHQAKAPVNLDGIAADLGLAVYRHVLAKDIAGQIVRDRR